VNFAAGDPEATLLERESELELLSAALAAARAGDGALVTVEGPAGIGKTRLLRAACEEARVAGATTLRADGSELERGYVFGIARALFEPVLATADAGRRSALLDGPARLALPALGLGPTGRDAGVPADRETLQAVVHGLYWLTANLAAQEPVLLAVDDLHWADEASQRYLAYLARRLEGSSVALVVALRPAATGEDRPLAESFLEDDRAIALRPAPLSRAAVSAVAAARLGVPADPAFATACHHATGGNALLVRELMRALEGRGAAPDAAAAHIVPTMGPARVARAVLRRIDSLPAGAAALTQAVAVLGDRAPLDLAARLAGLDAATATQAAAALAAADVLADDVPLSFRHPVVREAVADAMPAVARASAHDRAARLLSERNAAPAAVAAHLLAATPAADAWVVERLRDAAREARAQGSPELAATYLARALAEPPVANARGAVLSELGSAQLAAGRPEGTRQLETAITLVEDPRRRARLALELADWLVPTFRWAAAAATARRARQDLGDRDRELGLLLDGLLAVCARMDPSIGSDEAERLRRRAPQLTGDTPAERYVLACAAALTPDDTADEHARTAELMIATARGGVRPPGMPGTDIATTLMRAGRFDQADAFVAADIEAARRDGRVATYAVLVGMRGYLQVDRGQLLLAEADLRAALELAEEVGGPAGSLAALLALVHAEQGRLEDAERLLHEHAMTGQLPELQMMTPVLYGRARVRALQGRREQALTDAIEVGRRYEQLGIQRAVPAWRSLAAVQLQALGDSDRARELISEELALAERWGTPLAIGLALRGAGLIERDVERLAAAVDALEDSPARLEVARAQVDLGAALRRSGRRADARVPLRAGMDLAHACGATRLAEKARDELRGTGARPRRLALSGAQSLTAAERRIADLASTGLTNRRIAQELFVTTATVETHLRHVFQKLDVRSRDQLAAALAAPEPPPT
jgi:DNA-binding CsgD family transcriptional regulator/tetratricopeptide (TPR) repeat protein